MWAIIILLSEKSINKIESYRKLYNKSLDQVH